MYVVLKLLLFSPLSTSQQATTAQSQPISSSSFQSALQNASAVSMEQAPLPQLQPQLPVAKPEWWMPTAMETNNVLQCFSKNYKIMKYKYLHWKPEI